MALQMSEDVPASEVSKIDGQGAPESGSFSGRLYNGSDAWTLREVTIRIVLKTSDPGSPLPPRQTDYRIRNLWIPPREIRSVEADVLTPRGFEFDSWNIVSARGLKSYW
jgi:hypothetical protein